jgi:hypothetical protein
MQNLQVLKSIEELELKLSIIEEEKISIKELIINSCSYRKEHYDLVASICTEISNIKNKIIELDPSKKIDYFTGVISTNSIQFPIVSADSISNDAIVLKLDNSLSDENKNNIVQMLRSYQSICLRDEIELGYAKIDPNNKNKYIPIFESNYDPLTLQITITGDIDNVHYFFKNNKLCDSFVLKIIENHITIV